MALGVLEAPPPQHTRPSNREAASMPTRGSLRRGARGRFAGVGVGPGVWGHPLYDGRGRPLPPLYEDCNIPPEADFYLVRAPSPTLSCTGLCPVPLIGKPLMDCTVTADGKLWWPHTEALYALVLAFTTTGSAWLPCGSP